MLETFNVVLNKKNGGEFHLPCTQVTLKTSRLSPIGIVKFRYLRSADVICDMGDEIVIQMDDTNVTKSVKNIFKGYVFSATYQEDELIEVTAYDAMRYLKTTRSYVWEKEALSDKLAEIAKDYSLELGAIESSEAKITEVYEGKQILEMLIDVLLETNAKTGKLYNLYCNGEGKICLQNIESMTLADPIVGDQSLLHGYTFKESIDERTYNTILITRKSKKKGKTEVYEKTDADSVGKYGVLTFSKKADNETATPEEWAEALLKLRKYPTMSISLTAFGNINVHAGVVLPVSIGEIGVNHTYFLVENCTHTFERGLHTMSIELYIPQPMYPKYR